MQDRPLRMPPVAHKAVKRATANYERLRGELAAQHKLVTICEQRHATAQAAAGAEHQALVQAAREGKPEPARTSSNTALAIEESRQRLVVLTDAVGEARNEIDEVLRSNLSEIATAAEKRRDADRTAYLETLNKLHVLSGTLDDSDGEVRFFARWGEDPAKAMWPQQPRRASELWSQGNQENALPVGEVLTLLRHAEMPAEPRPTTTSGTGGL